MWIDGKEVVNNRGLYGPRVKVGLTVKLSAGYHDIKMEQFERWGAAVLNAYYKGPDTANKMQVIKGLSVT